MVQITSPSPKVYNRKNKDAPIGSVYVGRPTKWGNPFKIGPNCTREEAVALFKQDMEAKPEMLKQIKHELKGKDLVCWCAPKACHADVLMEIANGN